LRLIDALFVEQVNSGLGGLNVIGTPFNSLVLSFEMKQATGI